MNVWALILGLLILVQMKERKVVGLADRRYQEMNARCGSLERQVLVIKKIVRSVDEFTPYC